jgi:hypothetical protein
MYHRVTGNTGNYRYRYVHILFYCISIIGVHINLRSKSMRIRNVNPEQKPLPYLLWYRHRNLKYDTGTTSTGTYLTSGVWLGTILTENFPITFLKSVTIRITVPVPTHILSNKNNKARNSSRADNS